MAPSVFLRVFSTGAPRRLSIELLRALEKARLGWDVDFHWFKLFTSNPLNELFAQARTTKADFVILLPDDIAPADPADLYKMVERNVPVCDALLPVWNTGTLYWNCYHLTPDDVLFSVDHTHMQNVEQVYQTALGMGCYRRDVVDAFAGEAAFVGNEHPDGTLADQGGSDVEFCRELHRRDIPMFVDTTVKVKHFRPVELSELVDAFQAHRPTSYGLPAMVRKDVRELRFPRCASYRKNWNEGKVYRPSGI